jgi:deoxyribodipyrimidine photolyase-related protein
MRKSNYFNATRKLGSQWWSAETGLIPIDDIIKRVHRYAYAHHIERLMYLAAPMMMCGVSPDEMYNWFISVVSIDAYDWVMVPNIYGMGSFADGGKMMSRPYFSSGKYISKMSNWNDEKTITLWTNLFYNFIGENIPQMKANYYTSRYVNNYNNKSDREKNIIKDSARKFIELVTV